MTEIIEDGAKIAEQIDRRNPRVKYLVATMFVALLGGNAGLEGFELWTGSDAAEEALQNVADLAAVVGKSITDQDSVNAETTRQIEGIVEAVDDLVTASVDAMETANANHLFALSQMDINEKDRDRKQLVIERESLTRVIQRLNDDQENIPDQYYRDLSSYNLRVSDLETEIADLKIRQHR